MTSAMHRRDREARAVAALLDRARAGQGGGHLPLRPALGQLDRVPRPQALGSDGVAMLIAVRDGDRPLGTRAMDHLRLGPLGAAAARRPLNDTAVA